MSLKDKIETKEAQICVIGLGYVGLPLATGFARAGYRVFGLDVDGEKVAALQRGESYIQDVSPQEVGPLVSAGTLVPTTDYATLGFVDAIFICVPTPFDEMKAPDLSFIVKAAEGIVPHLRPEQLVILQSTTYPGTTEEVVLPILERSGLKAGVDFHLAFSPERINPGDKVFTVANTPKVVGGLTPQCGELARALLAQLSSEVHLVSSPRVAEMTKLLENIYRSVNIALVNELALLSERMGIDIWEVIEAASTKPFGFMPFYPGPGVGGHCLSPEEYIFVKHNQGLRAVRIGEYFAQLEQSGYSTKQDFAGLTLLKLRDTEILSFDTSNGSTCYKPLLYMSRRQYDGTMVHITTADGRRLTVTDGHRLIVWKDGKSIFKRAIDLQPGDELVVPTQVPATEDQTLTIDLITHLSEDEIVKTKVTPRIKTERFATYRRRLTPYLKSRCKNYKNIYALNTMPLSVYLELEQLGAVPFSREEICLCTGRGRTWNTMPAVVSIDEDLARLLGYYLSEGCITEYESKPTLCTIFTFNEDEQECIQDVKRTLESIGVKYSCNKDKTRSSYYIRVWSTLFGKLIRDILGCGTNSYTMHIPDFLLAAAEPLRVSLLAGLLRGDGDVYHEQRVRSCVKNGRAYKHYINTATVGFFSASPILFHQTVMLLQGLGIVPTFKKDKPQLRLYGAEQLNRLLPLFAGEKRAKLENYKQGRRKRMPNKKFVNHGTFVIVSIQDVSKTQGNDVVYSLEVETTHTFLTSYGLVVGNCIPVDPYYLSWKAREYDFYTKFIELAAEVNQAMPYHVVNKISEGLSRQGKPLRGARVLILGVTFKRDVDDARNSPAQRIIELLLAQEAQVSYNDPYVPQFKVGRNVFYRDELTLRSAELSEKLLAQHDCAVIVAGHTCYDYAWVVKHAPLVIDTVNATKGVKEGREKILRIGVPNA